MLTSNTINREDLTVFEARKDDNGEIGYFQFPSLDINLLYTGELNVADTLTVGRTVGDYYMTTSSYSDLRKYGFLLTTK